MPSGKGTGLMNRLWVQIPIQYRNIPSKFLNVREVSCGGRGEAGGGGRRRGGSRSAIISKEGYTARQSGP